MATVNDAHVRLLGADPANADGLNAAEVAGLDPGKLLVLLAKWGPVGAAMLRSAIALFNHFSWAAFWSFLTANGPSAFQFFFDMIQLFGQPTPAPGHVGALPLAA